MLNKLELDAVLSKAEPFLMSRSFAPILTHFCFDDNTVTAFNDLQAIVINYKSGITCALPGTVLMKMMSSLQHNVLDVVQKTNEVVITCGKSKMKFPSLPKEDFIFEMPELDNCRKVKLPLDVISGLSQCLVSTSHDLASPEKNGIRLIVENGILEFYSTDTVSLSRFRYESKNVPQCSIDIIIPGVFCEELVKLTRSKISDEEEIAYVNILISEEEDNSFLVAEVDENIKIFTRLIDVDTKMDFKTVVDAYESNLESWNVIPKELTTIINRACILMPPDDKFVTTLEAKDSTLFVDTITKSGIVDETIEFENELEKGLMKVNPETLKRMLKTATHIAFCFSKQFLAVSGCNGNFLHLISGKEIEQ